MLSPQSIEIIKQTVPILAEHGEDLTRHFYRRMFTNNPEVKTLFNAAHQHSGSQQKALAAAILAYAQHIENPAALKDALELIAHKHVSLNILPEHYPIVGENLLASIKDVMGDAATDQVIDAWAQAYEVLAQVLIAREAEIYEHHETQHGWQGFKPFKVQEKQQESDIITSFYLVPEDGQALPVFKPGQYITVRMPSPDTQTTMRNYSLSCSPDAAYYRISVKRESPLTTQAPAGYVSNYLHDQVEIGDVIEVAPPCGNFVLETDQNDARPLVLISGGVGITPILSMLHAALTSQPTRTIWFIHGALNSQSHVFRSEVEALAQQHDNLHVHIRYSDPTKVDRLESNFDSEGFIDLPFLSELVKTPDASFYFCGPKPLMASVFQSLQAWGVNDADVHYEFFGPAEALQTPAQACPASAAS